MTTDLLDTTLVSRLLGRALGHGGEFAEVYVQKRKTLGLELDDGIIRSTSSAAVHGVGIRVIRGAATGYAHSDDLSEEALLLCAESAAQIAQHSQSGEMVKPLQQTQRPTHSDPKQPPSETSIDGRLDFLMRAHREASRVSTNLEKILGGYADTDEEILIANSEGLLIHDRRALCRLSLQVILKDKEEDGRPKVGYYGGGSRVGTQHFESILTPETIAAEAVRMASAQMGARAAPVGEQTVVLGPASSGILLHEAIGHGLEADFIRKKSSLFTDRVGDSVASELCTVIDTGTLEGRRGSLNVDDEGTPTQENVLIEKGILRAYMSDKHNAKLMGAVSSGNGRRQSFRHIPLPRMTNTYLAPGEHDPEEIVKEVKSGLYCRAFGGGQVDIANGNFVFEVREGYLIEDGRITAPVQGATLVGNGPDALAKVSRVGSDLDFDPGVYTCGKAGQSVPVTVGLPTVRLDGITVGGTG